MMKNNIPLYLQYILARYFTAKTGLEQLSWILEKEFSEDLIKGIMTKNLQEFDSDFNFFPNPEIANIYALFADHLNTHLSGI